MNSPSLIQLPNHAYPFTLNDLSELNHRGYTLSNVHENLSNEQRESLVDFWLANDALPNREVAVARSRQACYLITHSASGDLIGLTTLYSGQVGEPPQQYLMMRMFIAPKHRPSPLAITGVGLTKVFVRTKLAERGYAGLVHVNENAKLSRPTVRKLFEQGGYKLLGQSQGNDVWFFDFAKYQFIDA